MVRWYILDSNNDPQLVDVMTAAYWFEDRANDSKRIVARTDINEGCFVSTVFLCIDHSLGDSEPLLYETMIFGGTNDGICRRYSNKTEALKGHQEVVQLVRGQ